jgi:hypothetical protein
MSAPSIQALLEAGPQLLTDWLAEVVDGRTDLQEGFNWLLLAEGSTDKANQADDCATKVAWTRVAVALYARLAYESQLAPPTWWSPPDFALSAMHLRVNAILGCGAVRGDPLQDPVSVVHWFLTGVDVSYEQAERFIREWEAVCHTPEAHQFLAHQLSRIGALRHLKHRISCVRRLVDAQVVASNPELERWLNLGPHLI